LSLAILDSSWSASALRIIASAAIAIATSLAVYLALRTWVEPHGSSEPEDSATSLASSLIVYARELERSRKDSALMDLRNRASRLLHLLGAREQREELGHLALEAASRQGDRLTQASILIDDLGWTLFEMGRTDDAAVNIHEAILLITTHLDDQGASDALYELRAKAHRHLVAIEAERRHFALAREALAHAREDGQRLPEPIRAVTLAHLDYSEATLVDIELVSRYGVNGIVSPETLEYSTIMDALGLCTNCATVYELHLDVERLAKVAKLRTRLLGHTADRTAQREAAARLKDYESRAARNLKILRT
jgi:hypothetical protein